MRFEHPCFLDAVARTCSAPNCSTGFWPCCPNWFECKHGAMSKHYAPYVDEQWDARTRCCCTDYVPPMDSVVRLPSCANCTKRHNCPGNTSQGPDGPKCETVERSCRNCKWILDVDHTNPYLLGACTYKVPTWAADAVNNEYRVYVNANGLNIVDGAEFRKCVCWEQRDDE
jgi:hypothetical protein